MNNGTKEGGRERWTAGKLCNSMGTGDKEMEAFDFYFCSDDVIIDWGRS